MLKVVWRGGVAHLHGTVAGQRIRESARTRDPKTAEQVRSEREAKLHRASLYGADREATFAEAALLYQEAGKRRRYLAPLIRELGRYRLAAIKPGDLQALALKLYPEPRYANSTRNTNVLKPARAVINFAAERGLCSPIKVKRFHEPLFVDRPPGTREWLDRFRAACGNPYLSAMALFMWVTAARPEECILLRPEDLDLDNKRATSPVEGKNGDKRIYYLTEELVAELRALPPRRINYGRGPLRVFGWACRQGPDVLWRQIVAKARLPKLTMYEAGRHGFGTETIVRQRIDPVTAARLGNWKDVNILLQRYAHPAELPERAEEIFGRAPGAVRSGTRVTQRRRKAS